MPTHGEVGGAGDVVVDVAGVVVLCALLARPRAPVGPRFPFLPAAPVTANQQWHT